MAGGARAGCSREGAVRELQVNIQPHLWCIKISFLFFLFLKKDGVSIVTLQQMSGSLFMPGLLCIAHREAATLQPWTGILAETPKLILRACPARVLDVYSHHEDSEPEAWVQGAWADGRGHKP